jgi:hypothetical protein
VITSAEFCVPMSSERAKGPLGSIGMGEGVGMVVGGLLAVAMIVYRDRTVMPGAAYHPV